MDLYKRMIPAFLLCGICVFSSRAQSVIPWRKAVPFATPPPSMTLFGFSFNETTGRWTRGDKASVLLRLPPEALEKPSYLEFDVEPFVEEGLVPVQRVTIYSDTREIARWECRTPGKYRVDIPAGDVRQGLLNLVFDMPDSYRLKGTEDDPHIRTFGLFFRTVTLKTSVPERQPKPTVPVVRGKPRRPVRRKPAPVRPHPEEPSGETASVPETPKPEPPKTETPKPEPPKPETPKPETPKPEPPKPETPKPEPPKPEPEPVKPEPAPAKPEPPKPETPKPEPIPAKPESPTQEPPKPPIPADMMIPETVRTPPKALKPIVPGEKVFFSEDNDCLRVSGFYFPEKDGRWTKWSVAYLKLNLPSLRDMPLPALEFDVEPLPGPPMTIPIRLNDCPVGVWQCSSRKICKVLLGAVPRKGGPILLSFSIPEARVPDELKDVPGARKLGLLFRSVKLVPDGRKQAELTKLLMRSDELESFPVGQPVFPGKAGKMLLLKGWTILPDGSVVNTGQIAELCFMVRPDLPEEVTEASLELAPYSDDVHGSVRYLNILCNGFPIDSVVCVKPEEYRIPVACRNGKAVCISIEISGIPEESCAGTFRLNKLQLFSNPRSVQGSLPESEREE